MRAVSGVSAEYITDAARSEQEKGPDSMSEISMASVRVPNDLIERAIENSGMRGCTLTNLVRAGVAALAILPSEQALKIADQALKDYGNVRGRKLRPSEKQSV